MLSYLLFLLPTCGPAPSAPSDCHRLLTQAYRALTAFNASGEDGVLHLQMQTESYYIPPGQTKEQHSTSTIESYAQGTRSAILTSAGSTWQDEQYTVTVIRPQKAIVIARSQSANPVTGAGTLLAMRDSLLQQGTIIACAPTPANVQVTYVKLKLSKKAVALTKAESMEFWIDTRATTIQKFQVNYLPKRLQTRTLVRFVKQEHVAKAEALLVSPRRQVLSASGQLLPVYAGYRLVDQSQQRPK